MADNACSIKALCIFIVASTVQNLHAQTNDGQRWASPLIDNSSRKTLVAAGEETAKTCAPQKRIIDSARIELRPEYIADALSVSYHCEADTGTTWKNPFRRDEANIDRIVIEEAIPVLKDSPFHWDMTYRLAFDQANAPANETMRKYYRDAWLQAAYISKASIPQATLFDNIPTDTVSAVLIDTIVPYYGVRSAEFKISTDRTGEVRSFEQKKTSILTKGERPDAVNVLAELLMKYQPVEPPSPRPYAAPGLIDQFSSSGYMGVISIYLNGKSRQFAFTVNDLYDPSDKSHKAEGGLAALFRMASLSGEERQRAQDAQKNNELMMPLISASGAGDIEKIKQFVDAGGDVNGIANGRSALGEAAKLGKLESIDALLNTGKINQTSLDDALREAIEHGNLDIVKRLITAGANTEFSLQFAINSMYSNRVDMVKELVNAKANIQYTRDGTPIMIYVMKSPRADLATFDYLIAQGSAVEVESRGTTPLILTSYPRGLSCKENAEHLIESLLKAGADINRELDGCVTALSYAQLKHNGLVEKILLKHNAKLYQSSFCANKQNSSLPTRETNRKTIRKD